MSSYFVAKTNYTFAKQRKFENFTFNLKFFARIAGYFGSAKNTMRKSRNRFVYHTKRKFGWKFRGGREFMINISYLFSFFKAINENYEIKTPTLGWIFSPTARTNAFILLHLHFNYLKEFMPAQFDFILLHKAWFFAIRHLEFSIIIKTTDEFVNLMNFEPGKI